MGKAEIAEGILMASASVGGCGHLGIVVVYVRPVVG